MNDKELFELCKEVSKATGWKPEGGLVWSEAGVLGESFGGLVETYPNYTSDHLLDKLPILFNSEGNPEPVTLWKHQSSYSAEIATGYYVHADTPLKALLKLVIVLEDAGELHKGIKPTENK